MAASIPTGRVSYNPTLLHVRTISVNEAAAPGEKKFGLNLAEFDEVILVGTPLGGATAFTVDVNFWSEAKDGTPNGGFVPALPAISLSFTASGQRAIVRVAHHGSVFFQVPSITGGTGDRVRLEVAGIPAFNRRG